MVAAASAAPPPPRTSAVTGLRLRASQLGETVTAKSGGRTGGRRLAGAHSAFVQRAANEASAATTTLLVKHGVAGPNVPSFEVLCAAMHSLRHRVLVKTHVVTMAPLVIMECEDEADDRETSHAADPAASQPGQCSAASATPDDPLRVVMHRPMFDRACGSGSRFVVFGPFLEMKGGRLLFVSHAEALPYPSLRAPTSTWTSVLQSQSSGVDAEW